MKKNFLIFSFFFVFSLNSFSQENDNVEVDLLFLKIQELEIEIADLRNKLESQDYLIQKLIQVISIILIQLVLYDFLVLTMLKVKKRFTKQQ